MPKVNHVDHHRSIAANILDDVRDSLDKLIRDVEERDRLVKQIESYGSHRYLQGTNSR